MTRWHRAAALLACGLAGAAAADHHTLRLHELYSSADGMVQFVLLRESEGMNGQNLLAGRTLTVTQAGRTRTFVFPGSLPGSNTANRYVLLATPGYQAAANDYAEFAAVAPDFVIPNGFLPTDGGVVDYAGVDTMAYTALPRDGFSAVYRSGESVRDNLAQNFSGAAATLPVIPVTAVEYFNATLVHYFISDLAPDIAALDAARIAGWARTGQSFKVWPISMGFLHNVCRYYIPPAHGDSHFFSASAAECATIAAQIGINPNYSGYVLETADAFSVALPDANGVCAYNWLPVYRLWNHRADSNHRYTIDPLVKAQMQARGYVAEGYGPNAVAMCSPK